MRHTLRLLGLALLPLAVVVAGVVAAWKYVTTRDDAFEPNGPVMRRIRAEDAKAALARELEDQLVTRPPRRVADGPAPRPDALSKPWDSR